MTEPLRLVAKPTTEADIAERVRTILGEINALYRDGELVEIFAIVRRIDDHWMLKRSGATSMAAVVGRLEIAKQELIKIYLEQE